jgi:phage baseplate assembly protein W
VASKFFSDFRNNLNTYPTSNDIQEVSDEAAVKQSIVNLIKTNFFDRPFQPGLGSYVNSLLFENITTQTIDFIRQSIKDTIDIYEPRALVNSIVVSPAPDDNALIVTIVFSIINKREPITIDLLLNKVR